MLRRPGLAGLKRNEDVKRVFQETGQQIEAGIMETMSKQLTTFRTALETFAKNHKAEINRNPHFRAQFQKMCAHVGVDPLASQKGFWAQLLGFGDFYYELAVQIIEICIVTRTQNGGLISIEELLTRLRSRRAAITGAQEISEDDVYRAIRSVDCLGTNSCCESCA